MPTRPHRPEPEASGSAPAGATPQLGTSLEGLPLLLTVDEAAGLLRISRSAAYDLAREYIATDGRCGLPAIRLGRRILVRRDDLAVIVQRRAS